MQEMERDGTARTDQNEMMMVTSVGESVRGRGQSESKCGSVTCRDSN